MSMCTFGWRLSRKKQDSIQSGRPPCATMIVSRGKSTATSSRSIGSPYLLRASGKIDVPVRWMELEDADAVRLDDVLQRPGRIGRETRVDAADRHQPVLVAAAVAA